MHHRRAGRRASRGHQRLADLRLNALFGGDALPPAAWARSRPRTAAPRPRRPRSGLATRSLRRTPGTSVRKRMRVAPSPTASAAAASSAFTFSGPSASGATTGMRPAASASRIAEGALGSGVPTQPSSGTGVARRPISSPARPTARGPMAAHSSRLTSSSASRTTRSRLVGHAAPADEGHLEPGECHRRRDLRSPPCTTTASSSSPSSESTTAPPTLTTITSCTPR